MDRARSDTATLGDPDDQRDPAFCDCGHLDLSPVLAACAPESLARLGEPNSEPFLSTNLQFRQRLEPWKSFCALCRIISALSLKSDFAGDMCHVNVRIYPSNSSSRTESTLNPNLAYLTPFLMIGFAPGSPPGSPTGWLQFKEYAFPGNHISKIVLPKPDVWIQRHAPAELGRWEAHLECAVDQRLNWGGIKMALSGCQTKHHDSCGRLVPRRIPSLHVIDCASRTLIPFPDYGTTRNVEYATLSYVWGAATETPAISSGSHLPADIPLVVADAISVCLQLGLQYLWVDRYCILQHDAESKHAQIRNMNLIYKQSELTIIAAAGSGPSYGLPGVSRHRLNVPQKSMLKLGAHVIVPLMSEWKKLEASYDMHMDSFAGSTWNSRGWTYQEAVVSRRRLIFTDRLVVYQCWESMWDERFPSTEPTTPSARAMTKLSMASGVPQFLSHGPIGLDASDFGNHASEYFGRHFTYMSDQLLAFQGILQEFASSAAALQHLCAVPVYQVSSSPSASRLQTRPRPRSRVSEKLKSLLGRKQRLEPSCGPELSALAGFVPGLCWDLVPKDASVGVSPRRDGAACLPSWSWMSWRAPCRMYDVCFPLDRNHLEFSASDFPDNYDLLVKEIRVGFGNTKEQSSVPNDRESALDIALGLDILDALYLRITAWAFEARFMEPPTGYISFDAYDRAPYHARLRRTDRAANDRYVLVGPKDTREKLQCATFVVMFSVEDGSQTVCLALQPCTKHGNGGCFERIGLLYLRRQESVDVKTWDRHSPGKWSAGGMENTLFADSFPSEVCRMTSVYVC